MVLRRRSATLEEMRYEVGRRVCFLPEAGKAEDSRMIGESDAERGERNPPLCFGVKDAGGLYSRMLEAQRELLVELLNPDERIDSDQLVLV